MCSNWEPIATQIHEDFVIRVYVSPEDDIAPEGQMEDDDVRAIREGRLDWFKVKVVAYKNGIELGDDYLGGCAYESPFDFVNEEDGYFVDMRDTAVRRAKAAIAGLMVKDYSGTDSGYESARGVANDEQTRIHGGSTDPWAEAMGD